MFCISARLQPGRKRQRGFGVSNELVHPVCPGVPWKEPTCVWQVKKEMTRQKSPWMRGPAGRSSKREPSPGGLGINSEDDLSAVGAALKPEPAPTVVIRSEAERLLCAPAPAQVWVSLALAQTLKTLNHRFPAQRHPFFTATIQDFLPAQVYEIRFPCI